jgi:hypothetical protein
VGDVLSLGRPGRSFDTVIDAGVFHVFDDADRARYVSSMMSVLPPGGTRHLLCLNEHQPFARSRPLGPFRPRRVSQDELRAAFGDGWAVTAIAADTFELKRGSGNAGAQAWLATFRRL